jgi:hypothetical protein
MFSFLRKVLFRGSRSGGTTSSSDPRLFIYVKIPGDIQPLERGARFEEPLQKMLQASGLGTITGGGSQMGDPYPDGRSKVEFCGLDIDVLDRDRARTLLRDELTQMGTPLGTELHYTVDAGALLDRREAEGWRLELKREMLHPKFAI